MRKEQEKQIMCPKCGRNQEMINMGDEENPIWFYPTHRIIRGNGSKKVINCQNSGKSLE